MSASPNIESEEKPKMEQVKRKRGRPKGAKDRRPRAVKPPQSAYGAGPADIDEMIEDLVEAEGRQLQAEGNGGDHTLYDQGPAEPARLHVQGMEGMLTAERPAPAKPTLPDLFIHRVENGYIVRPAYAQGDHRTSSDVRTWVVANKEQLAELVVSLIAEPVVHTTPQRQAQDYYSPPLIVETATNPLG
jgi:hypothetical protein